MSKHPYIRPDEMGSSTRQLTIRIVQDGTRTVAEIYNGDETVARFADPMGVGHAIRRKGDKRNPGLGVALAIARAFESASEGIMENVREAYGE